jgi:hypothetical protein
LIPNTRRRQFGDDTASLKFGCNLCPELHPPADLRPFQFLTFGSPVFDGRLDADVSSTAADDAPDIRAGKVLLRDDARERIAARLGVNARFLPRHIRLFVDPCVPSSRVGNFLERASAFLVKEIANRTARVYRMARATDQRNAERNLAGDPKVAEGK